MEEKAISSDLIRGHIDTIILHALSDGDKFAQQISDSIEAKSGNEYKINQATLYSSLKRLETLKFVSSYWNDSDNGRRKFFKLTESGKNTVESNLSSWSYSRTIIDKLMDCEPNNQPKIIETVKERIVEVPVYIEKPVEIVQNSQQITQNSNESAIEKPVNDSILSQKDQQETTQELNFRTILSGLVKATSVQKSTQQKDLEPFSRESEQDIPKEKLKFNDTIVQTDYNAHKASNTGKIDFGDLTLKAAKEGYKLRISSKDSVVSPGNVLINKLNVCSAMAIYLILMLEFLFISLRYKNVLSPSPIITIALIIAFSSFPIIMAVKFFKAPLFKTSKKVSADSILTAAIIVFNLLMITLAANLLAGVDFKDVFTILLSLAIPCIIFADVLLYFIIKYYFAKTKIFLIERKKNIK